MNAELQAYLDRLIIPARKEYARAYAEHVMTGAAAPKVPKGIDHDTLDKIQRKVRKYAALSPLKRSPVRETHTEPAQSIPDGLLALPETLRHWAAAHGDTELLEILRAHGLEPEVPPVDTDGGEPALVNAGGCMEPMTNYMELVNGERMSDHYNPERTPAFIDTSECDALDITDLEPYLARALALKLAAWNGRDGKGSVYEKRNGRRYLSRRIKCIDLNDPIVQQLPNYCDLAAVVKERGVHVN